MGSAQKQGSKIQMSAAKKSITPIPPISPIQVGAFSFTDADFFRRCVAERADTRPLVPPTTIEWVAADIHTRLDSLRETKNPVTRTDLLVSIAALCERAAVDITIPASRIPKGRVSASSGVKQKSITRSARTASKPTASRKGARP
jgi:hypothetical protein